MAWEDVESEDRVIPFEGALTFVQFREANVLHQGRYSRLLSWILIGAFTLPGLVVGDLQYRHGESLRPALMIRVVPTIVLLLLGLIEWSVRKAWTTSPSLLVVYPSRAVFHLLPRSFLGTEADSSAAPLPPRRLARTPDRAVSSGESSGRPRLCAPSPPRSRPRGSAA